MGKLSNVTISMFGNSIGSSEQIGTEIKNYFNKLNHVLIDEDGAFHQVFQKVIPPIIINHVHERFWTETGPDGNAWARLTDLTVRLKTEAGYQYIQSPGILQATRYMYESIQELPAEGWTITIGTDAPYAYRHQFGDILLSKREFMGMDSTLEFKIQSELQSELNKITLML